MAKKKSLLAIVALLAIITVAIAALGCGTAASSGVPLRYSYAAGDTWAYDLTLVLNGTVEGIKTTPPVDTALPKDTTTKMRVSSAVKDVTDGVATVGITYEVLAVTANGEPVDTQAQTKQEITVKVDQTGKVISVEGGLGPSANLLGSGMPFDPTELSRQFSVMFPEDGVAQIGDEWSNTSKFPIPGMGQELTATTIAKLVAATDENGRHVATIDYSVAVPMDLTLDLGAMLQQMAQGMGGTDTSDMAFKMVMKGSVDFTGTTKVDTAASRVLSANGVEKAELQMTLTEAPEELVPKDERGPFDMSMTVDITIDKIN